MAEKVVMPALSPTMEVGTISRWVKKEGETVGTGDVLCEVETDKATMDYESVNEGVLLKIMIGDGGRAKVGDAIAIVGQKGEDISSLLQPEASPATQKEPAKAPPAEQPEKPKTAEPKTEQEENLPGGIRATPLARRIAKEKGIDLGAIQGSGPQGRIVKEDLEKAPVAAPTPPPQPSRPQPRPAAGPEGDVVVPLSEKRRIIAQRMTESVQTAPHYFLKVVADAEAMLALRKRHNARSPEKVSFNAFLTKFAAEALRRHPIVNSSWAGDSIIRRRQIDIGLAVAQPDGLIAPVVRDCGRKGVDAINQEQKDLIDRALKGQLAPEEYKNPTFTISNLGSFGITEFTAIINAPAAAILAVGEIRREPVVGPSDEITIRSRMTLTLSCDHRVVDGAVGAAFLKDLKDIIEDPVRVLF